MENARTLDLDLTVHAPAITQESVVNMNMMRAKQAIAKMEPHVLMKDKVTHACVCQGSLERIATKISSIAKKIRVLLQQYA